MRTTIELFGVSNMMNRFSLLYPRGLVPWTECQITKMATSEELVQLNIQAKQTLLL